MIRKLPECKVHAIETPCAHVFALRGTIRHTVSTLMACPNLLSVTATEAIQDLRTHARRLDSIAENLERIQLDIARAERGETG